jgi:2-polyprenyl-3-methyl-5-hydroxy-6-metoxy-1,4-benzoquinol methylase
VQPYETFDLVCAFEALENTQDQIATLRSWAKHVNEHGSLIISISARLRRFERQEIKKLLAAGDLEEVSIQPYGALGGHVMEFVSAKILNRWVPAIQLNSLVAAKLLAAVAVPLKLLQRPFLHTSVGVGWVVVARRKRGAL